MANVKISELNALTPPDAADLVPVTDSSASQTKRTTVGEIVGIINGDVDVANDGTATISELPVNKLADGAARQLLQTDAAGTGVEWTSNVDVPGTLDVTDVATLDDALNVTGLASLDGGIDVDGAFTVADTSGNISTTGTLDVDGEATLASAIIENVTDNRVLIAGTGGAVEDDANFVFDGSELNIGAGSFTASTTGAVAVGSTLDVTGATGIDGDFDVATDKFTVNATSGNTAVAGTIDVEGQSTFASANVEDLTNNQVVIAGTSGELEGDANFTFDGTDLDVGAGNFQITAASGNTSIAGTLDVTGASNVAAINATGLASLDGGIDVDGAFTVADTSGNIATTGTLGVTGQSTLASAAVSDLTSGRVVLAGASGEIEDSANLVFNGSELGITGTLDVSSNATVGGDLTVVGDLTVEGATTTLETQTVTVEDKNIELGVVGTPTDTTADGGGITLKGATDKTINWVDATDAWTFSEHVDIASAKEFRIAGTKVLDATSLGSAVVSSSLTSVGTIGTGIWQGTTIATGYGGTGIAGGYTNGELLIGKTDGTLAKATLTAGNGIDITNADGSIAIDVDLKANGGLVLESTELAVDLGASAITGTLGVADGGTGQTTYTDGELLIGTTAGSLAKATITAGSGIDVTNGDGSIAVAIDSSVVTTSDTGTVTSTMILDGTIVNGDINASAAIADTKLDTISTAGKVSNSATTATDANTANAIVARDASGDFTAGTITADLTGNADTATALETARDIGGVSFDGTANINLPGVNTTGNQDTSGNAATATKLDSSRTFEVTGDVTGTVSSDLTSGASIATSIASGVIVDADVNGSAAIAGTKIDPDFGSQTVETTGVFSAAGGAAATPSIAFTGDLNTGIYSPGADQLALSTNGTGRLFVDASGNVGIGTSSPDYKLHVNQSISSGFERVAELAHGADSKFKLVTANGSSTNSAGEVVSRFGIYYEGTGWDTYINYIRGSLQQVGSIAFSTADAERMRIDSAGRLLVGTSSQSGGSLLQVNDDRIRIASSKTPASASDTGTAGEICWDSSYIYVCTATDTWKRAALSTW